MADESIDELWARLQRQIADNIAKHGQQVQVVHLTEDDPPGTQPFMYTIGNYRNGLPELLPDTQGRWPDTPGCDAPYRDQPILSKVGSARH
jgi:hypothetical protein